MSRKVLLTALALGATCMQVWAQVAFRAQISQKKIGLQDQFQVTFTIDNADNLDNLYVPNFKDFKVLAGPIQNSITNNINGHVSSSQSYSYILAPRATGKFTIPAARAGINGQPMQTNALTLEVAPGSMQQAQPQARSPFGGNPFFDDPFEEQRRPPARQQPMDAIPLKDAIFLKVDVNKTSAMIGEPVQATYKLYTMLPMNMGISKLPSLNGFWTQDFQLDPQAKPTLEKVNGRTYNVFVLKKSALFPQQTGKLLLDPAEVRGVVRVIKNERVKRRNPLAEMMENDPFFKDNPFKDFFENDPFYDEMMQQTYEDVETALVSKPVVVNVIDLPEQNKPESFTGAVGNFTAEATLDRNELTTDDATTLHIKIKGSGNLKLIQNPIVQFPKDFILYDPVSADTITERTSLISGEKTFDYTFQSKVPGQFTIPPIAFSYFDPESKQYKTVKTASFTLEVKPGKKSENDATVLKDIHDINTGALQAQQPSRPFMAHPLYWMGMLLPVFAVGGVLAWRKRQEALQGDVAGYRKQKANKVALKRLSVAAKYLKAGDAGPFYEEVSKAIWLYASDKLNIPLAHLSKEMLQQQLTVRKVPAALQEKIFGLVDTCEIALYAPVSQESERQHTYNQALQLIGALEDVLKR